MVLIHVIGVRFPVRLPKIKDRPQGWCFIFVYFHVERTPRGSDNQTKRAKRQNLFWLFRVSADYILA